MKVTDLQQLFTLALQHDKMLVYGNLGRYPSLLVEYLSSHYPMLDILIVSKFYTFPSSSSKIRQVTPEEITKCDLLIYVEPLPYTLLDRKPLSAARLLILSSHLLFRPKKDEVYTTAVYFHEQQASKTKLLLERKDGDVQEVKHIEMAKKRIDFMNVVTIGVSTDSDIILGKFPKQLDTPTYILINLTQSKSPLSMMLYFWDAFDYMLENLNFIERWSICFPEKGSHIFESLTQECINQLFCYNFSHIKDILSLIPYYKSGIVDRSFDDITTHRFVNMEYVSPQTTMECLKANIRYDLEPLVGSVYKLK